MTGLRHPATSEMALARNVPGTCLELAKRGRLHDWRQRRTQLLLHCADLQLRLLELPQLGSDLSPHLGAGRNARQPGQNGE